MSNYREISVIGLGPGNPGDMSVGAARALHRADIVILRTGLHPAVEALAQMGIPYSTCDDIYNTAGNFDEVYDLITDRVISAAEPGVLVAYAVPGHPSVFEHTTTLIRRKCQELDIEFRLVGSPSFLDSTFAALEVDPRHNITILDAMEMSGLTLAPDKSYLIAQVYDREIASNVKLTLADFFNEEHTITIIRAAGVPGEQLIETIPLYELDRIEWVDYLTSVFVPAVQPNNSPGSTNHSGSRPLKQATQFPLDPLTDVVEELRGENGCPWDREQTHMSLRPFVLEEAYEVVEAIELGEMNKLCEELGDLLLQIALHSQIASECGIFDINDVVRDITGKMVRRHPHVFADGTAKTPDEVLERWQVIKQGEKGRSARLRSVLGEIPRHLPALMRAYKIQSKAGKVGFDWKEAAEVFPKVLEEVEELRVVKSSGDARLVESEVGDLLFAVVNLSRHLGVDPEVALSSAVSKFVKRFMYVEEKARSKGKSLKDMSLEEMDDLWNEAKKSGL